MKPQANEFMICFKQIIGWFLIVIAIVVAAHTIIEPLYHGSGKVQYDIWGFINPFMALGIVLGTACSGCCKIRIGNTGANVPVTWERLRINVLFYGFLSIGILFFWNWFSDLAGGNAILLLWIIINTAFPLLSGAMGLFLLYGNQSKV